MSETLSYVSTITATRTDDSVVASDRPVVMSVGEALAYLGESPRHVLVVEGLVEASGECVVGVGVKVAVIRGADDATFYVGVVPLEDPGDCTQVGVDASLALLMALDWLCSADGS